MLWLVWRCCLTETSHLLCYVTRIIQFCSSYGKGGGSSPYSRPRVKCDLVWFWSPCSQEQTSQDHIGMKYNLVLGPSQVDENTIQYCIVIICRSLGMNQIQQVRRLGKVAEHFSHGLNDSLIQNSRLSESTLLNLFIWFNSLNQSTTQAIRDWFDTRLI